MNFICSLLAFYFILFFKVGTIFVIAWTLKLVPPLCFVFYVHITIFVIAWTLKLVPPLCFVFYVHITIFYNCMDVKVSSATVSCVLCSHYYFL